MRFENNYELEGFLNIMKRFLYALAAVGVMSPMAKADVTYNFVNYVFSSFSNPKTLFAPGRFTGSLTGIDWNITGTNASGTLYYSSDIALAIDNDQTVGGGVAQFGGTQTGIP
ncbi:MAG: hypothetical protein ACOVT5_05655, partial [Armatimonadaceae bacterium]